MIGRTLGFYFLRRYGAIAAWNFVGIAALVFIVTFTEVAGRASGFENYTIGWALAVASLQLPILMQQAVPFIGLIAAMATLISLNRKYELVIARAAGISAWQFLTPITFGAFLFGLIALLVLNPIAALGFAKSEALQAEVRGASTIANSQTTRWLKQRTENGEAFIGADATTDNGTTLIRPAFLLVGPDGHITERLDAQSATLQDGYWQLESAVRHREAVPSERMETLRLATNLRPEYVSQELLDPQALSIFQLPFRIQEADSLGLRASSFATQFHSLVALPALLVAMTLIAATVSMRFTRLGQSGTMILGGILAGFLLYVVSVLMKAFGGSGVVPPLIAAWTPVIIATFFGITFLLFKEDG